MTRMKMMETNFDLEKYETLVKELTEAGLSEAMAKVVSYEKLIADANQEQYSPFETINS